MTSVALKLGRPSSRDTVQVPKRIAPGVALLLVCLVLLAFVVRLGRVGDASYWGDELVSVTVGQLPTSDVPQWVADNDPHPPLYYLAIHGWMTLVGSGEFATRTLSVLLGTLAVPLLLALGRRLVGATAAGYGALLIAVNPLHIAQSRDARMYPLLVALSLASVLLLMRLRSRSSPAGWTAYVIVSALSLYTHYYAGLVLVAQGLFVIGLLRRNPRFVRRWLIAGVAIAAAFLPWLIPGLTVVGDYEGYTWSPGEAGPGSLFVALRSCIDVFLLGPWVPDGATRPAIELAVLAVLAAGGIALFRKSKGAVAFLLLYLFTPISIIYVASFSRPIFTPKYLIAASPAFYLLIAYCAAQLPVLFRHRVIRYSASVAILMAITGFEAAGLFHLMSDPALANADWRAAARYVTARERPTDGLIYGHDGVKWLFSYYHRSQLDEYIPPFGVAGREREIDSALQRFASDRERVWFIPWWQSETDVYVERWLNANAYKILNRWSGPIRITEFATSIREPAEFAPAAFDFGGLLELSGWKKDRSVAAPGDVVRIAFTWRAKDDVEDNVKVLLRLVDRSGRTFAEIDRLPRDGPTIGWTEGQQVIDRYGLLIPPGTPAGTYRLDLDLYHEETGERLRPRNPNALGQRVILGELTVEDPGRAFPADAVDAGSLSTYVAQGAVRLAGFTLGDAPRRPGDFVPLSLYWQPMVDHAAVPVTIFIGEASGPVASVVVTAGATGKAGSISRQDIAFRVRPMTTPGKYDVWLSDSGSGGARERLGTVPVVAPPPLPSAKMPERQVGVNVGQFATLVGTTVTRAGDGLDVYLLWRANEEAEKSYTVFVQLIGADGRLLAQSDQIPAAGAAPTSGWLPGQSLADEHHLKVGSIPTGSRIVVGLYDPATFERLPAGNADFVELPWP